MIIKSVEGRVWIRLRHQYRGSAQPAADVGDLRAPGELLFHSRERRNPTAGQIRNIVGAEKTLGAVKQIMMMFMPTDSFAGAERFLDLFRIVKTRGNDLKGAGKISRTVFDRESQSLFRRQRVSPCLRVIDYITAGCVGIQPLANVPLLRSGAFRQLSRRDRSGIGHRLIKTQFVAEHNQHGVHGRAHIANSSAHKLIQFRFVDGQRRLRSTHSYLPNNSIAVQGGPVYLETFASKRSTDRRPRP